MAFPSQLSEDVVGRASDPLYDELPEDDPLSDYSCSGDEAPNGIRVDLEERKQRFAEVVGYLGVNAVLTIVGGLFLLAAEMSESERNKAVLAGVGCLMGISAIASTYQYAGTAGFARWSWFQPLQGSLTFLTFQVLGWMFFVFTLMLPIVPWFLASLYPGLALKGFVICAGLAGVLGQVMMICSLITRQGSWEDGPRTSITRFLQSDTRNAWWSTFVGLQVLIALMGAGFAVLIEVYQYRSWSALVVNTFAICAFSLSMFLTYGVGGPMRHKKWSFFQPLVGGFMFVTLQAISWIFFGLSMVIFLLHLYCAMAETWRDDVVCSWRYSLPSLTSAGVAGVAAQVLTAGSLLVFQEFRGGPGKEAPAPRQGLRATLRSLSCTAIVCACYNVDKFVIVFMVFMLFLARSAPMTAVSMYIVMAASYFQTFLGNPSTSGRRAIVGPAARGGARGHPFFQAFVEYFNFRILRPDGAAPLDARERYVFGFHPHGILPLTMTWAVFSPVWARLFPGITPAPLTSSILHYVPLMRDFNQLCSGFEVSRTGFREGLRLLGSVILIPGGQIEMIESRSNAAVTVVKTSHKGFIRLSMQTAAATGRKHSLVPVYSFGEPKVLDNVYLPKSWQLAVLRAFRANVFFLPYGAFNLPGVPRPVPLALAVGDPIPVPPVADPSPQQVALLHRLYYTSLADLADAKRGDAAAATPGVRLDPPVEPLRRAEFQRAWDAAPRLAAPTPVRPEQDSKMEQLVVGLFFSMFFVPVVYLAYFTPR